MSSESGPRISGRRGGVYGVLRGDDPGLKRATSGWAGFWNVMRLYPDESLGVVVMGNSTSYDHESNLDAAVGLA